MVMEDMRLKPCSTSTTVVEAPDHESTKLLQEELQKKKSEEKVPVRKTKRKKTSETKQVKKSKREVENVEKYECCFECKESDGINRSENTLRVSGFDPSLTRDDIKTALKKHFGSCGVVTRVFVPIECKTGATIGYAFVDMQSNADKVLTLLSGSSLGGWNLEVMMGKYNSDITNLKGCERCSFIKRVVERFIATNGGRCLKTNFKFP
ncbi:hypothetical protein AALP_AAs66918U001100 [Arabis alpina]|uniref:RRM domain-containing protein n=1 Tax=Arabis alpina TaxID=50452 RepID=A0A087G0Z5_ARAAL|nr:hypothetical protein AALP_AAs66918U001100 [Arabis alpina]